MRRSVREALVGFSILAAIVGGGGLWLWLRGISLRRDTWTIQASFTDAAGLANRSPVSFRGVFVGNVRNIEVTGEEVLATLEITDSNLRLSRPVVARVASGSVLGGEALVSLLSSGEPLPEGMPGPRSADCDNKRIVCDGGSVPGVAAASLDTVTDTVQQLLDEARDAKLVPSMVAATRSFDRTAKEVQLLTRQGQRFLATADGVAADVRRAVGQTDPILANVRAASADAAGASRNVRELTGRLNSPTTVADLEATIANARRLTQRWGAVGGDVGKLTGDPDFRDGVLSIAVGLGSFFEELYPAEVGAARDREARKREAAGEPPPPPPEPGPTSLEDRRQWSPPPRPRKRRTLSAADQQEAETRRPGARIQPR
jgi:phospholipid/cholesterol/gamma-HCH transport system substrate-binding protein